MVIGGFMKKRKLIQYGVILTTILLYWISGLAGTTGKIAGVVTDKNTGEPIIGANVYLEGTVLGASTDADGYYYIINVPPGTYTVVVQMIGYKTVKMENVRINVNLTTHLDFELTETAIEGEEVVVVAHRPIVQKDLTSTVANISSDEIKALPVDNFQQVVELQAGVVGGHFRGGRTGEVSYLIDGIPVNDPFNNSMGATVENGAIQQLEVISGTFNAEYGQAMSGVVNIVTKEGGENFDANVMAYKSFYATPHDYIFPNLNSFSGNGITNIEATLSGPVPFLAKKVKFFSLIRWYDDEGYIFGPHLYDISDDDPYMPSGDSSFVAESWGKSFSSNSKFTLNVTKSIKLNYSVLYNHGKNRYYNHSFRLVPDAPKFHFTDRLNQSVQLNHALNSSSFYNVKIAYNYASYKGYLFKNKMDPRYLYANNGLPRSNYTFRSGGLESDRYDRSTESYIFKADYHNQINKIHKIQTGIEYKKHVINNFWTDIDVNSSLSQGKVIYPQVYSPNVELYKKKPEEFSAYIQDKIEYDNFIINLGIRYDYFNPNTKMPEDPKNVELISNFNTNLKQAKAKSQISPRLSVAFPISSQGVIRASYGHFFQIPRFELLYAGIADSANVTKYYLPRTENLSALKGNPDLNAERTTQYELGLQQALNEVMGIDFTIYYRDVRNLVGTEIIETYDVKKYARYINHDYGNIRGAVISFEKRFSNHWGGRVDFTYQFAEGNSSDPRTVFFDNQADPPREPEKKMIRLDWDQRTSLSFTFNVGTPGNWMVSLVGNYGSGMPYTAASRFLLANITFRNNRTKPYYLNFDLKMDKTFTIAKQKIRMFLWIWNLFDRLNEINVYSSTGRADRDIDVEGTAGDIYGLHTLKDYITNPTFYSAPRQIRLGISYEF